MLADYLAQLAHARDLLSIEPEVDRSYFDQSLADTVADARALLVGDAARVDRLRHEHDPWIDRRNRFLDLLLALYAEEMPRELPGHCGNGSMDIEENGKKLIAVKLGLLQQLVAVTRSRGRGFDYLAQQSARNAAGMEIRSRLQLGMKLDQASSEDRPELHIVEHVLLRAGRRLRGAKSLRGQFEYSLTVSVVVCLPEDPDPGFRHQVAALLRSNVPAHVLVLTRFVEPAQARSFKTLYTAWCDALHAREPRPIVQSSAALRDFLVHCPAEPDEVAGAHDGGGGLS